jgi:uncharacterized protein (TIGR03083 family)
MHASADQTASHGSVAAATSSAPRLSTLDRDMARQLMATEYERVVDQLRSLSDSDWQAPTCNSGWDVLALSKHMLGMTAMAASVREQIRQMRTAKKRGGEFIDALTALQVETYDGWSGGRVVAEIERLAPRAVKGRGRTPGLLRGRTMPDPQPIDPPKLYERWTFGYLIDVILTRDPWMHRTDIAGATGGGLVLSADHDGMIVADVAREWAERHGQPCTLTLTGPAGGTIQFGSNGPSLRYDAVEFCRTLSGRGEGGAGLLKTRVPF